MIFLRDNVFLERKLTSDDIKHRLLGHWGTCPGLVLVYAHLTRIIKKRDLDALLVVGPGWFCSRVYSVYSNLFYRYSRSRRSGHSLLFVAGGVTRKFLAALLP